jgi:hypothetical protein
MNNSDMNLIKIAATTRDISEFGQIIWLRDNSDKPSCCVAAAGIPNTVM